MFFAPHVLYKKQLPPLEFDEYGQALEYTEEQQQEWLLVSECRCDDVSRQEVTDSNGRVIRPSYHIVFPSHALNKVEVGDTIKVVPKRAPSEVRGTGVVKNKKGLNCLDYSELWV